MSSLGLYLMPLIRLFRPCCVETSIRSYTVQSTGEAPALLTPVVRVQLLFRLFFPTVVSSILGVIFTLQMFASPGRPDGSISSRIDLIGCPLSWSSSISDCSFIHCPFSDHSAVSLDVSVPGTIPPGPGNWKLNVSILKDADFVSQLSVFWLYWQSRKSCFSSLPEWWDEGKAKIKTFAVQFCCQKS